VPYDYYTLPFCKPAAGVQTSAENLGEFLTGDRIDNSPYQLYMRDDSYCNILCQKKYNKKDVETFKKAVTEEYHHNWIIDNLPVIKRVYLSVYDGGGVVGRVSWGGEVGGE
jgi:transmembrane 9 superfamily protein 2/4